MNFDSYEDIARFLIDKYNFCTISNNIYTRETDYNTEIQVANPSRFLVNFLTPSFYYINDNPNTKFHDLNFVNFLENYDRKVSELSLSGALNNAKPLILEVGMYPAKFNYLRKGLFDVLFKNQKLLSRLKNGTAFLFVNFAYEADNFFESSDYQSHYSYYDMFRQISEDYKLRKDSIILLNSNVNKTYHHRNGDASIKLIFESALQPLTFKNNYIDVDYSVEQYLENIKRTDINRVLRVNRTHLMSRDFMLYYLYNSNNLSETLVEHNSFLNPNNTKLDDHLYGFKKTSKKLQEISENLDLGLEDFFEYDEDTIDDIIKDMPLRASIKESSKWDSNKSIYSNTPIPTDIYKNSMLSWVSTSLYERKYQVFHNQSIFNPMLYYHPLLISGNPYTHRFLVAEEYHHYDWLSNQTLLDWPEDWETRFLLSVYEMNKIYNMDKEELLKLISDNHGSLNYNRTQVFQCNPIRSILYNLAETISKYYKSTI
jgi:hypothetical protein